MMVEISVSPLTFMFNLEGFLTTILIRQKNHFFAHKRTKNNCGLEYIKKICLSTLHIQELITKIFKSGLVSSVYQIII